MDVATALDNHALTGTCISTYTNTYKHSLYKLTLHACIPLTADVEKRGVESVPPPDRDSPSPVPNTSPTGSTPPTDYVVPINNREQEHQCKQERMEDPMDLQRDTAPTTYHDGSPPRVPTISPESYTTNTSHSDNHTGKSVPLSTHNDQAPVIDIVSLSSTTPPTSSTNANNTSSTNANNTITTINVHDDPVSTTGIPSHTIHIYIYTSSLSNPVSTLPHITPGRMIVLPCSRCRQPIALVQSPDNTNNNSERDVQIDWIYTCFPCMSETSRNANPYPYITHPSSSEE